MSSTEPRPLVLVAVGTDFHPFDRVVGWIDGWLESGAADAVDVLVQYGHSKPPTVAQGSGLLDHEDLQDAMARAAVVVCHGGPATITEARRHGKLPICVPRDPERGEHVDSHQQLFARRMGAGGIVHLAETQHELRAALDQALAEPAAFHVAVGADGSATANTDRFADLVSQLLPPADPTSRVPVLYLGGLGRSGSTLLERAIAQVDGVACVGEVVHLWERGLRDNELCGCGTPFNDCDFWSKVGAAAFGGWNTLNIDEVLALKASVDRTRFARKLLREEHDGDFGVRLRKYGDLLTRLYAAVLEVSGASVVVDASKHASTALVLAATPGIDLKVLHVVRDSPAVAYSWTKKIPRPEAGPDEFMATWTPVQTAMHWSSENALLDKLVGRGVPSQLVRYEDFAANPRGTLAQLMAFLGRAGDEAALSFVDGNSMHLDPSHTVAGNPMRFTSGRVDVVPDTAWSAHFPQSKQRLVGSLTAPIRRRYGYPIRSEQ